MTNAIMNCRMLTLVLAGGLMLPCTGQIPPVIVWQNSYGGSVEDQALTIVKSGDGGFFVAGKTKSADFDILGHHGSVGSDDALIMKLDSNGTVLWQQCLGGVGVEVAWDMVPSGGGGCVVACSVSSTSGNMVGAYGGTDFCLVSLDAVGNIVGQEVYGGSSSDWQVYLDNTADSGYILCGETQSTDVDISFNHGVSDLWIVKLDSSFNIQWEKSYGGADGEYAVEIIQNSFGGYYVSGLTQSNDGDVTGNHGGLYDAWVLRLDEFGNLLWQRALGGSDTELPLSIIEDGQGGLVCAGSSASADGDLIANSGSGDLWIFNLDSTGNMLWQQNYGNGWNDGAKCIAQANSSGYLIAGYFGGTNGYDNGLWLLEVDSVGVIRWESSIGGTGTATAEDIFVEDDGDLLVTGWATTGDGDVGGNNGMSDLWTVKLTQNFSSLIGTAFVDPNSNGVQDGSEIGISNYPIRNLSSGLSYYTDFNGGISVVATDTGTTTVGPLNPPYHSFSPTHHVANFPSLSNAIDSLNDFALQPNGVYSDLCVSLTPAGIFRQERLVHYTVSYINVGTTNISAPILRFVMDQHLTYQFASLTPSAINGDTLTWQLPAAGPFESGSVDVFVSVPSTTPIGTTIASVVSIGPMLGDANIHNNTASWEVEVIGSADPNDILVDQDQILYTDLSPIPPDLDYIIRFQNTGTDTAFTVRIENAIPENADLSTFQFVSSSHPAQIDYLQHVDRFNYTFNNILLPDSNTNEAASHGYFRYRIKPKSTLMVGDSVLNTAGIYFDFNAPVITNTAFTVIESTVEISELGESLFRVSPNPSPGAFSIKTAANEEGTVTITDVTGRVVEQTVFNGKKQLFDLSGQPAGVYFVTLGTGDEEFTEKLVIER